MKIRLYAACLIWIAMFALSSYVALAAAPYFDPSIDLVVFNYSQNQAVYIKVNATSPDNNSIRYDFHAYLNNSHTADWLAFRMNNMTGEINFTARNGDVTYPYAHENLREVLITIIDNQSQHSSAIIWFNVTNVNDPPNITGVTPIPFNQSINENSSVGFTFNYNASDPDLPYGDALTTEWLVNGVNITSNQSWVYRPTFCESGIKNITLWVCDLVGACDFREWNITVNKVNRVPVFNWTNPIQNITWNENQILLNNISLDNYFFDPDIECGPVAVNFTVRGNTHILVNISNQTGHNVSFYPDMFWNGTEKVNFTYSDGYNATTSNNVLLTIIFVPYPPVIENITNKTAYVFAPFYYRVNATSPNGLPLTYYDDTSLFDINPADGRISFTPDASMVGNHTIMINVSDGNFNVFNTFNLEVINNTRPVINPLPDMIGLKGTIFSFQTDGLDLEGDAISYVTNYTNMGLPNASNSTGATFSFMPRSADVGNHSILVTATDARGATSSISFNLEVYNVHLPPSWNQVLTSVIVKVNHTTVIQLNATSDDGSGLVFTHNSTPADFLDFQMTAGGLITIVANDSDWGNHTVRINVSDSAPLPLSTIMDVLFIVTPNRPPVFQVLGMQNATQNSTFRLRINATDPDFDPVTFYTNTSFNFSSQGYFSFVPNQSAVGLWNITLNASDGDGGWGYTTFLLNISDLNEPPYFNPPLENYSIWNSIYESSPVLMYINATDPEDDDLFFSSTFLSGTGIFSITKIARDQAILNFTANRTMIGNYSVNFTVGDGRSGTFVIINFSVRPVNYPPVITRVYPYGGPVSPITVQAYANKTLFPGNSTNMTGAENSSQYFTYDFFDDNNDTASPSWYLDGLLVSQAPYYNYSMEFGSAGLHNLTLAINDSQYADLFSWLIGVNRTNQAPVFGMKIDSAPADFLQGSYDQVNISRSGLTLAVNGGPYYGSGSYYSRTFDMGNDFAYASIDWAAVLPAGTSFTLATSTSASISSGWSNWSFIPDTASVATSNISSDSKRYFRYWINLTTSDTNLTPTVQDVVVNYVIANMTQVERFYTIQNSSGSYWFDLDDFFYDPGESNLTYSFTSDGDTSVADIWIESWNGNHVGIRSNKAGSYNVYFTATDQDGLNASSNNITLTFSNDPTQGSSNLEGSVTTQIVVQTRIQQVEKEVDKYVNLDIIVPEALTVYQNSTIVSPIRIENTGTRPLQLIDLTASTNVSGVKFDFTQSSFALLAPGESVRTNLIITSAEFLGTYEITVKADVKNPTFSDSAKIIISSLEKGSLNRTQLNTKITFTKDLLLSNPECLELNELLTQAEEMVNQSKFVKANELIEQAIRDCRYLIASKDSMKEKPTLLETWFIKIFGLTSKKQVLIFASAIIGIFVLLTASLLIERARVKKAAAGKKR